MKWKNSSHCTDWEIEMSALLDGELGALERDQLEAHCRDCSDCGEAFARLQCLQQATLQSAEVVQSELANPDWESIRAVLTPRSHVSFPYLKWASLAAGLALGIFVLGGWNPFRNNTLIVVEESAPHERFNIPSTWDVQARTEEQFAAALVSSFLVGNPDIQIEGMLNQSLAQKVQSLFIQ